MVKVSRIPMDSKYYGYYLNNLWSAFTLIDSKEDIKALFADLVTPTERKMFAKRLEIARRLLRGERYEDIKKELKVTATTIANINNILSEKGEGFRKADSKLSDLEDKRKKKIQSHQDYLERSKRIKPKAETFLFDLGKELIRSSSKKIKKIKKTKSADHEFIL